MTMRITVKGGADFSESGAPKLQLLPANFKAADLEALYLFQDFASGEAITKMLDKSGKGRDANAIYAGSAVQGEAGIVCGADGIVFVTPVPIVAPYTVITVSSLGMVAGSASSQFPGSAFASAALTQASGRPSYSQSSSGARLAINRGMAAVNAGTIDMGVFGRNGAINTGGRRNIIRASTPENSFACGGYSVSADGTRSALGFDGQTSEFVSSGPLAAALTGAGFHAFGVASLNAFTLAGSGIQFAAVLNKEFRGADLLALIAGAKAEVAARGETVH